MLLNYALILFSRTGLLIENACYEAKQDRSLFDLIRLPECQAGIASNGEFLIIGTRERLLLSVTRPVLTVPKKLCRYSSDTSWLRVKVNRGPCLQPHQSSIEKASERNANIYVDSLNGSSLMGAFGSGFESNYQLIVPFGWTK